MDWMIYGANGYTGELIAREGAGLVGTKEINRSGLVYCRKPRG